MRKSGLADSPFFDQPKPGIETNPPADLPEKTHLSKETELQAHRHAINQSSYPDTMALRYHDTIIETIRKAVREFGKEAATHRFTQAEKHMITDMIYSYNNLGIKTSENEIARIAVNFVSQDYKDHGENSLLDRVLKALHG